MACGYQSKVYEPCSNGNANITTTAASVGMADAGAEKAVALCDELLQWVSNQASNAEKQRMQLLRTDPDDPWADDLRVPSSVWKERCPETGYLLTRPFETAVPLQAAFKRDASWLKGLLNPQLRPNADTGADFNAQPRETGSSRAAGVGSAAAADVSFDTLLLKVARVDKVEEDDNWSDKLFIARKVNAGEDTARQIVAGLRGKIAKEALEGSLVVVAANMKKQKLAGVRSDGMIIAAETHDGGACPLTPPPGSTPGERVFLQHQQPNNAPPKECRSSHWQAIQAKLSSQNGSACFDGTPLVTSVGTVATAPSVPDGASIK